MQYRNQEGSERYSAFTEGYDLMSKLAALLAGEAAPTSTSVVSPPPPSTPAPASGNFVHIANGTFIMGKS
ncbi:MAG: hypothetical protein LBU17_12125 [Treponema sp.]|nr:hypothetical protein [Treponema sp.]